MFLHVVKLYGTTHYAVLFCVCVMYQFAVLSLPFMDQYVSVYYCSFKSEVYSRLANISSHYQ